MLIRFEGHSPSRGEGVYIAPGASVIGRVSLGNQASVWPGTVLRGDVGSITIGARTNIQDLTVVHVSSGTHDTVVGDDVTVGHGCILHGCTIQSHVLVGMGAVVMDGAEIGAYSLIGAGALVTPGKRIPERSLVLGSPARVARQVTEAELEQIRYSAEHYVQLAQRYQGAVQIGC